MSKILDQYGRPMARLKRSYNAAQPVARYGDLGSSRGSADYELRNSLAELRAKARFLARNSTAIKRYIQLMKVNVVGEKGFLLKSRVRMANGKVHVTLNDQVETAWTNWCMEPTVDGQMNIIGLLNQMVSTWCRDGEVIWEIVYGAEYPDGISINPIESDLLDETLNSENPATGNEIRMGVEVNKYGRPVAYHFLTTHPGDLTWYSYKADKRYRRVAADRVIHMFIRDRPGQTRGEPPTSAVVLSIKMSDGYREAETMNRRLRSALMGFFTRDLPQLGGVSEIADREVTDEENPLFEMDMEPGRLKQLPDGMSFSSFDPGGMQGDFDKFDGQIKKDVAMGLGISTMSHGMEVQGVSYSSGRTVIQEDRDLYRTMQCFFIDNGLLKLFRKWLPRHILSDASQIRPSMTMTILSRVTFRARGWDWVDPSKDVKANAEALATKQTSLARIAAARGIDRDDLLDEIQEDEEAAASRGLTLNYTGDTTEPQDLEDDTSASA